MRIWFTRGFSLQAIGACVQEALPAHHVLISGGPGRPGDRFVAIEEPGTGDEASYLDFVRATVAREAIDLVVPTRRAALLDRSRDGIACRIETAAPAASLDTINDKLAFARALGDDPLLPVGFAVHGLDDFDRAIAWFEERGKVACIKPAKGVNGAGFQTLIDDDLLTQLAFPDRREIRPEVMRTAIRAAERAGTLEPQIVMEFLPGEELSFDALCWHGRLLKYAVRTKIDEQVQTLVTRHELAGEVAALIERFALHGLVNVQFRHRADGTPAILEINPRPAGGSVFSEQAGGGLIGDWARLLAGEMQAREVASTDIAVTLRRDGGMRVVPDPDTVGRRGP